MLQCELLHDLETYQVAQAAETQQGTGRQKQQQCVDDRTRLERQQSGMFEKLRKGLGLLDKVDIYIVFLSNKLEFVLAPLAMSGFNLISSYFQVLMVASLTFKF